VQNVDAFPRQALIRRINAEPAVALGAGRALLLQLAHPAVAQGVQDHSDFKRNPFKRLQGTLEAMYAVVFGPEDLADGVGRRVQWIHEFVTGPAYAANDPVHLLWVHATLLDTALSCYESFVEPLTPAERETYYEQMTEVACRFGCTRADQPATYLDFRRYFDQTVAKMDVSDVGRDLGGFILAPALPLGLHLPLHPLLRFNRTLTVGLLPPELRARFGLAWSAADDAAFERHARRLRRLFARTPRALRTSGTRAQGVYLLWLARRHVRQFDERQRARAQMP
jgi:uncharacterized protein (DUF2236 family)